jgi:hypothetical protein
VFENTVFPTSYHCITCLPCPKNVGEAHLFQGILGAFSTSEPILCVNNVPLMFLMIIQTFFSCNFFRGSGAWPEPLLAYWFMPPYCQRGEGQAAIWNSKSGRTYCFCSPDLGKFGLLDPLGYCWLFSSFFFLFSLRNLVFSFRQLWSISQCIYKK